MTAAVAYVGAHTTIRPVWNLAAAGAQIVYPRRVPDTASSRLRKARLFRLRCRLRDYLVRTALRQMNAYYSHTGDAAGARDIVGHAELVAIAYQADRHGVTRWAAGWITLDHVDVDTAARDALRAVLRDWTPAFIDTASLAGRISKRPPKFTPTQYLQVQHMTQAKAAASMGCSVSTVKRLAALARRMGGAAKAAALVFATRVKRLYPERMGKGQITKVLGAVDLTGDHEERPLEGRSPP